MNTIELLAQDAPTLEEYPERIESLEIRAFEFGTEITRLETLAGEHEENAATEAAGESNADKRKTRKCELLRINDDYNQLRDSIIEARLLQYRLSERAARYRREYRLALLNLEMQALRMRA